MATPMPRAATMREVPYRQRPVARKRELTVGQRVITIYFTVAYFIPMLADVLLGDSVVSSYTSVQTTVYSAGLLVVVYSGAMAWSGIGVRILPRFDLRPLHKHAVRIGRFYPKLRLAIGVTALVLAIGNLGTGLNTYRYTEQSISEYSNPLLLVTVVLNMILNVDLLHWVLVNRKHDVPLFSRSRLEMIFLAAVLVISANGTATMMIALAVLGFSLFPRIGVSIVFVPQGGYGSRVVRLVGVVILGAAILGASWFAGETIKRRASTQVESIDDAQSSVKERILSDEKFLTNYFYYLVYRISIHYYSYLFTLDAPGDVLSAGESTPLLFPLRTAAFRADYVLGSPLNLPRPPISSIGRLNYLLLSANPIRDREGSAPGLIASFNYVVFFPLSLVLCALYAGTVAKLIDRFARNAEVGRWSVPGMLIVLLSLQGLFYSPFDLVMIFDDSFIYLSILTGVYLAYARSDRVRFPVGAQMPIQAIRPTIGRPLAIR
jgi:hypothetical protein